MFLLPGIFQVAGPSVSHHYDATAYLLPIKDELVLIDCGTPLGYEKVLANIRSLGFDPRRITRIYATHGHYDHIGAAGLFRRDFGTALLVHGDDAPQVERGDAVLTSASLLYGETAERIAVQQHISDMDCFSCDAGEISIWHTPGHSRGSCCFVLSHKTGVRLLVAGDTLHGGFSALVGSDEALWRKSLARIGKEHFDYYTFGHCSPQLLCDADTRIAVLIRSFANYYSPWFKVFNLNEPY